MFCYDGSDHWDIDPILFFKMEFNQQNSSIQNDTISIPQKPKSSALFTGREEILEKLKHHFAPQDQGNTQRKYFLLYGMGGIGKTQICLKFVEEMADRYSLLIYWLLKALKTFLDSPMSFGLMHPLKKQSLWVWRVFTSILMLKLLLVWALCPLSLLLHGFLHCRVIGFWCLIMLMANLKL